MDKKVKILVFPCGKENGLEILNSLKYAVNIEVFGGSSIRDHGVFVYEKYIGDIPFIQEPDFVPALNKIIESYGIDIIIPTHDTVSLFFAENRAKINAKIIAPDEKTARICREKDRTYKLFSDLDFVPEIYACVDDVPKSAFPIFLKPKIGEGGKNTCKCDSPEDAGNVLKKKGDEFLLTEFLSGEELTVDCFTDRTRKLQFIGPRFRNRVNMGISFNSTRCPVTEEIALIANTINSRMNFRGAWYFQVKRDKNNKLKLLEVSCRTAGTMVFYRMLGINFTLLSIYDALDYDIEILFNDIEIELDRCLKNRFLIKYEFDTVYIDFDDAVVINNKINDLAMQFIYQMLNRGKKIILITRHEADLLESLTKYRISPGLFDSIIHLSLNEDKHEHIDCKNSIFIDNSFAERKKVHEKLGIPVFDVDAIEGFIV